MDFFFPEKKIQIQNNKDFNRLKFVSGFNFELKSKLPVAFVFNLVFIKFNSNLYTHNIRHDTIVIRNVNIKKWNF